MQPKPGSSLSVITVGRPEILPCKPGLGANQGLGEVVATLLALLVVEVAMRVELWGFALIACAE